MSTEKASHHRENDDHVIDTTGMSEGKAAALELTERIYTDFKYDPRATTVSTPVREVFESRKGVCQDFAHFQIACLRSLRLPTRYVSGYLRTMPPPGKERLVGAQLQFFLQL